MQCSFDGANIANGSFVRATLSNVRARKAILSGAIFRNSHLRAVDLTASNLNCVFVTASTLEGCIVAEICGETLAFGQSTLETCELTNLAFTELRLEECVLKGCKLRDWQVSNADVSRTAIEHSRVSRIEFDAGRVISSKFLNCRLDNLNFGKSDNMCQDLDFSESTLAETHLGQLGLSSAGMLDTALIRCTWPPQTGHISWSGRYVKGAQLLLQPVQDIKGVPPLTRREIADAQFIVRRLEAASLTERFAIRLWSLCTGFGQSLTRLSITTASLILISTLGLLAARGQLFGWSPSLSLFLSALTQSFDAFFALANMPATQSNSELIVVALTRIGGFLVLGMWVTIASSKLSKLGAE